MNFLLTGWPRARQRRGAANDLGRARHFGARLRLETLEARIQPSSLLGFMDVLAADDSLLGSHRGHAGLSDSAMFSTATKGHRSGSSSTANSVSGEAFGVSATVTTALNANVRTMRRSEQRGFIRLQDNQNRAASE